MWLLRQQLSARKQQETESLANYAADIRRLCKRLGLSDSEGMHYFIQGLPCDIRATKNLGRSRKPGSSERGCINKHPLDWLSINLSPSFNLLSKVWRHLQVMHIKIRHQIWQLVIITQNQRYRIPVMRHTIRATHNTIDSSPHHLALGMTRAI